MLEITLQAKMCAAHRRRVSVMARAKIDGYGCAGYRGKSMSTHRLAWMLHNKCDIPKGMHILHRCKHKNCFEPSHLECGTHQKNMYDDRLRDGTLPRGESHHAATISDETALQIYNLRETWTRKARSKRFNVSQHLVKKIDLGESFAHVTGHNKGIERNRKRQRERNQEKQNSEPTMEDYIYAVANIFFKSMFNLFFICEHKI